MLSLVKHWLHLITSQILPGDLFRPQKHIEQILLYGSNALNLSENLTIFKLIQEFLLASDRFC